MGNLQSAIYLFLSFTVVIQVSQLFYIVLGYYRRILGLEFFFSGYASEDHKRTTHAGIMCKLYVGIQSVSNEYCLLLVKLESSFDGIEPIACQRTIE